MTDLAARIVGSLRNQHDQLAACVESLGHDQLVAPSGSSGWTVADVLSHLGSGAEIVYASLAAAAGRGGEHAGRPDRQAICDRWDAATPRDQAEDFIEHDARLVELVEDLTAAQRRALQVDLGFLPAPVSFETAAGMRLSEVTAHEWDVAVALDPEAALDAEAAEVLLDLLAGPMGFLLGFTAKAGAVSEPAEVQVGSRSIIISEGVSISAPAAPTARFHGPHEAVVRLLSGRLDAEHTPASVSVTGNVSLDDLRAVFPGY